MKAASARSPSALVMAAGTGGHIFPALAVAQALRERGWSVHWLGCPQGMEERIARDNAFAFEAVRFGGVRGKGALSLLKLPLRMARAMAQSRAVLRRVQPDVVLGFGGYISAPAGLAAALRRTPLLLHEQNAIAGMSNRVLATWATQVFAAFPDVLGRKAQWVGNPLRAAFLRQPPPAQRFAGRSGALKLLVLGGSLGAQALNAAVPQALALLAPPQRPQVLHQSGAQHEQTLTQAYAQAGVSAQLTPFIEDTAQAFADADLVLCRAGASTVTEIAAVGAAAVFVPFPHAVDDHQSANARHLVDAGGGWLLPQTQLTAQWLADFLKNITRAELLEKAQKAQQMQKLHATEAIVAACEELAA